MNEPEETVPDPDVSTPHVWPDPLIENFADDSWPILDTDDNATVERWVLEKNRILLRTITWNLCAKPPPSVSEVSTSLIGRNRFHLYVIGTEECERSIAASAWNPSKKSWEAFLIEAVGSNYVPIRSHTLQAIHLMAFVHKAIAHLCSVVTSAAVPTGIGSTLGNKGGVGIYFQVLQTRILIVNAHLAAHQTAEKRRNAEFNRINRMIPVLLEKKEAKITTTKSSNNLVSSSSSIRDNSSTGVAENNGTLPIGENTAANNQNTVVNDSNTGNINNVEGNTVEDTPANATVDGGVEDMPAPTSTPSAEVAADTTSATAEDAAAAAAAAVVDTASDVAVASAPPPETVVEVCTTTGNIPINAVSPPQDSQSSENDEDKMAASGAIESEGGNATALLDPEQSNTLVTNKDAANAQTQESVGSTGGGDGGGSSLVNANDSSGSAPTFTQSVNQENDGNTDALQEIRSPPSSDALDGEAILDVPETNTKTLEQTADLVVFMGDLNYRIKGNRRIVSSLLENNMYEVLHNNDQLQWNMNQKLVLQGFAEGPLHFRPTYKYDVGTQVYDSSSKGRIPSWTDRILYVPRSNGCVKCLAYNAVTDLVTSDHRPVYASFEVKLQHRHLPNETAEGLSVDTGEASGGNGGARMNMIGGGDRSSPQFTSESQVCTIM